MNSEKALAAEVVNLSTLSTLLPPPQQNEMIRDNVLIAISDAVLSGIPLIYVDAPSGTGKTVVLAQLVRNQPNQTFSVFINASNRYSCNTDFVVTELCVQLHFALNGTVLKDESACNQSNLQSLLARLARHAGRTKSSYTIIIDGLCDIPDSHSAVQREILALLPTGTPRLSVIISRTDGVAFPDELKLDPRKITITPFSRAEVREFFSKYTRDENLLNEIYIATQGRPLHLAAIVRLVDSGESLESLVRNDSTIFALEWKHVGNNDDVLLNSLAAVTLNAVSGNVEKLANIFSIKPEELSLKFSKLTFLNLVGGTCSFVSEPHRKYAEGRLKNRMRDVEEKVIAFHMRAPNSLDAFEELPQFFIRAGRSEELLDYLDAKRLQTVIEVTQSLYPVRQKTELGVKAALKAGKEDRLMSFTLQLGTLGEASKAAALRNELQALIALGDIDQALLIAESCPLKEDRLRLLSSLGQHLQTQNKNIPDSIIGQLKTITAQIEPDLLGEDLTEITGALAACDLRLAIEFVNRAKRTDNTASALDLALVQVSLAKIGRSETSSEDHEIRKVATEKIQRVEYKGIAKAFQGLMGVIDASSLEKEISEIPNPMDQLFLVRQWLLANRRHEKSLVVVEHALDLMIKTTSLAPNAKILREIATPLPYAKDIVRLSAVIKRIDAQRSTIDKLGPTEEIVRLEGLLARAEAAQDIEVCFRRCTSMVEYSARQIDSAVRVACLSRSLYSVLQCSKNHHAGLEALRSRVSESLDREMKLLLNETADHAASTRGSLSTLALADFTKAVEIACTLNAAERRDRAIADILGTIAQDNPDRWWLTNQGGLRIGNSANSLGLTKLSEISEMTAAEAAEKDSCLVGYVTRRLKLFSGQRVGYEFFAL